MTTITRDQVKTIGRHVRREHPTYSRLLTRVEVGRRILERVLGADWVTHYISSTPAHFFAGCWTPTLEQFLGARHVCDLAEMILNFQSIPGIDEVVAKLQTDDVEAEYGALEIAKWFFQDSIKFNFVKRSGVPGADYDLEVFPPRFDSVPVECKTTLEATKLGGSTIANRLEEARRQLPKSRLGAIVIRVPASLAGDDYLQTPFGKAAMDLLRNTERVGLIVFLSHIVRSFGTGDAQTTGHLTVAREFYNQKDGLEYARDWKLVRTGVFAKTPWISIAETIGHLTQDAKDRAEALAIKKFGRTSW